MEEILASIRRIISEEEADAAAPAAETEAPPEPPKAEEPPPEDEDEPDVLELTQIVTPRPKPSLVPPPEDDIAFAPEPEPEPAPLPEPEPFAETASHGLIADAVAAQAGAAFDLLSREMPVTHSGANVTLEAITRELLKPLLKQWLDQNLPDIVERIVREEVERVSSRRR